MVEMTNKRPTEPKGELVIDNFETRNLDKAAYLLIRGARFNDCYLQDPESRIAVIVLDGVNKRHAKAFWQDNLLVEFWTWKRTRKFLKVKIHEKHLQTLENRVI